MEIQLNTVAKKFGSSILFKGIDYTIKSGSRHAILGENGSGKSTLMQMLLGYIQPSKGTIIATQHNQTIATEDIPFYTSFAAPYMDLPEYLTMQEVIDLHFTFKEKLKDISIQTLIESIGLATHLNKQVRHFSSGMKQRLKLVLSLGSEAPLLMLDEPCANLDKGGMKWYSEHIEKLTHNRTVIIASNASLEYAICNHHLVISQYK